jgi:uncharacterized protein
MNVTVTPLPAPAERPARVKPSRSGAVEAGMRRRASRVRTPRGGFRNKTREAIMATTFDGHTPERRHLAERRAGSVAVQAKHLNTVDWISMALLIIGGINWGLIGLFNFNLVATLFGPTSALTRLIYVVVGLCALYTIYTGSKLSRRGVSRAT